MYRCKPLLFVPRLNRHPGYGVKRHRRALPYNPGMDTKEPAKKSADLSGVRFGTGKPKEPAKPEARPLTTWDIAWGVFMGLTLFKLADLLLG